jgi:mono/diheme cytochrome c family protein
VKFGNHRALIGVLAAGVLSLSVLGATAAPKKPAPKKPAPAAPKADPKAGKVAFSKEGCTGCHKTKDYPQAGEIGPDLSEIGKHESAAEISAYIKKPKSGSIMPAFKGPQATLDNLTAYMLTQK